MRYQPPSFGTLAMEILGFYQNFQKFESILLNFKENLPPQNLFEPPRLLIFQLFGDPLAY